MAEITTQDELNTYVEKGLRSKVEEFYKGIDDVTTTFKNHYHIASNGILNRCVDLENNLNVLKAVSYGIPEVIDRSTLLSNISYEVYDIKGGSDKISIKTNIPGSFGFNYISGYAPSASPEINAPSILNYMYSINTDEIFKFSGKETLHEIFNLDFESYLRYYDEIEELFDKLDTLRVSVNKVNKFRADVSGGSINSNAAVDTEKNRCAITSVKNIASFIVAVDEINSKNAEARYNFEEWLRELAYPIAMEAIVSKKVDEETFDRDTAYANAAYNVFTKYTENVENIQLECEDLNEKLEKMRSIREDFLNNYSRIEVLNTMIGDVTYDLNKAASDLESIPFTDASSYVENVRSVIVSNYSESGEVNTENLSKTTVFTDEEKIRMTERVSVDIMMDLGLMGDIDPAGRIVITSENYEDYIVNGEFDIYKVKEMLTIYSNEENPIIDAHTFSNADIENALFLYITGYANKNSYSIANGEVNGREWIEILTAYQMVLDYDSALAYGQIIVDIEITDEGYAFLVGEYVSTGKYIYDYNRVLVPSPPEWVVTRQEYKIQYTQENENISDLQIDIILDNVLEYLKGDLEDLKKSSEASIVNFLFTEGAERLFKEAFESIPILGTAMSLLDLIVYLEANNAKEEEIKQFIRDLIDLPDENLSRLDNMAGYKFSIIFSTGGKYIPNDETKITIIPNAKTIQIRNAASDISIVLNSEVGSPEYNQAMDRLQVTYEKNDGLGHVSDDFPMNNLLAYQTQIEELSNMTPEEIVENYDEYGGALFYVGTSVAIQKPKDKEKDKK